MGDSSPESTSGLNEFRAYYSLSGDFDPDAITQRVAIKPSNTWRKGEQHPQDPSWTYRESVWQLHSRLPSSTYIGDHVADVLEQLESAWTTFVELGTQYQAGIQCAIYMHEAQGVGSYWPVDLLRHIVELHAYIDIDCYCLAGGEE